MLNLRGVPSIVSSSPGRLLGMQLRLRPLSQEVREGLARPMGGTLLLLKCETPLLALSGGLFPAREARWLWMAFHERGSGQLARSPAVPLDLLIPSSGDGMEGSVHYLHCDGQGRGRRNP